MTKEQIYRKLQLLHDVLVADSLEKEVGRSGYFSVGERICINQERGTLFEYLDDLTGNYVSRFRNYTVSEELTTKIRKSYN